MYKNKPIRAYFCMGFGILNLMDWAKRRRIVIGIIVGAILASFLGIFAFVAITDPATCFDGEQNGIETGVDCGGACERVCEFEASSASVLFAQYVENDGRPDIIAHVKNNNAEADIVNAQYLVEVFTNEGDLLATRKGSIDIPSQTTKAIFIQQITPFVSPQARAFLTISNEEFFKKKEQPTFSIDSFAWSKLSTAPTLQAVVLGDDDKDYRRVPIIVTVFDVENKVIGTSRTIVSSLKNNTEEDALFTWQEPFSSSPARTVFTFDAL